ncbi:hypothetical protein R3P38DRAFT_3238268 [Favolaschia claudopus]|uniref:Uncharacterized protein n=1 Tax=Favolaschia claudopus TaxID=2862362 RepID=A0AAV9ZA33_9AGAR
MEHVLKYEFGARSLLCKLRAARGDSYLRARTFNLAASLLPPSEQPPAHAAKYPPIPIAVVTRRISRPSRRSRRSSGHSMPLSPRQKIFSRSHSVVSSPPVSRDPSAPSPTSSAASPLASALPSFAAGLSTAVLLREQHTSADYM